VPLPEIFKFLYMEMKHSGAAHLYALFMASKDLIVTQHTPTDNMRNRRTVLT